MYFNMITALQYVHKLGGVIICKQPFQDWRMKILLQRVLGKLVMKMEHGWQQLKIMPSGNIWHWNCWMR